MIEFESVGKTFRDGTAAVVDLTLTVPSDKITVIVGPSGCGKTTTLRMVNRMIEPTSGRILWDGSPLRSKRKTNLRRQMGYVIQNGGLFPHRTVVDNVGTVPGLLGWEKSKTRKRSMELLDSVGLDRKLANRYPAQLSGGQQQRVGVARALAADPLVMLMDEPFSAVDPVVRSELHELFLGLQRELSKTIILITHDIDEAIKLGDQVAILRVGGVLAQVGTPQQLLDEPADAFVEGFIGRDRGFRALSFLPASGLSLQRVRAVRDPASATANEPTLVVDAEAKPMGWVDGRRPGQMHALGSTFDPEKDNLRVALDAALTSPVGLAVAVTDDSRRYAGVANAADILALATVSRASVADAVARRGRPTEGDPQLSTTEESSTTTDESPARTEESATIADNSTPEAENAVNPEPTEEPAHHRSADLTASNSPEPTVEGRKDSFQSTDDDVVDQHVSGASPVTDATFVGDVPVDVQPAKREETEEAPTRAPAHPGEAAEPDDVEPAGDPGPEGSAAERRVSAGRGSEEPGVASDEFDLDRKSWNPFKKST